MRVTALMYKKSAFLMGFSVFILFFGFAGAKELPFPNSCYEIIGETKYLKEPKEVLFVLIDESAGFDENIVERVVTLVTSWLDEGKAIEVFRFSSFSKDRYTEKVIGGLADPAPTDEFLDNIKRSERLKFDQCHKKQLLLAKNQVRKAMLGIFSGSSTEIGHSDIVANLKTVSGHIKRSDAKLKKVLIVSDMLENSSITSFYESGQVRQIDPDQELAKVEKAGFMGDFYGAEVYIFGLGYFARSELSKKESYLDPKRLSLIKDFWANYIKKSNGKVAEIGTPMLLGNL
jgi:hypothetical protein